jgi:cyclopropane-fatty-acyl-phospholipid synthase
LSLPFAIEEIARGEVPDRALRAMLRFGLAAELRRQGEGDLDAVKARKESFVSQLRSSPIAVHTDAANTQHYELPPAFFQLFLGRHLKYSSGYWPEGVSDLDASERAMLDLVAERAGLADGQRILDLGCGWGSLSLYAAERFPNARVTGISNSTPQRLFLQDVARARGLTNVRFVTANVAEWHPTETGFDRIVSVEMFEHMRNWGALLGRIASWLTPEGRLFLHVFSHDRFAYAFESNWMADRFFTGGIMPSDDLILSFQDDLVVRERWRVDGRHYARTCEEWLVRIDERASEARAILTQAGGEDRAAVALAEWRLFFLSCAESFAYAGGSEWMVSHALLARPS